MPNSSWVSVSYLVPHGSFCWRLWLRQDCYLNFRACPLPAFFSRCLLRQTSSVYLTNKTRKTIKKKYLKLVSPSVAPQPVFWENSIWPDGENQHGFPSLRPHGRSCLAFSEGEENTSSQEEGPWINFSSTESWKWEIYRYYGKNSYTVAQSVSMICSRALHAQRRMPSSILRRELKKRRKNSEHP